MQLPNPLGRWRSRSTFVFALTASAVGLGNLWRFAYLAGEYGGGLFVLSYVVCLFGMAVPVLIAEVVLGSQGRGSAFGAWRFAVDRSLVGRTWSLFALLACITGVLILGYYTVVAGWSLDYAWQMSRGDFASASAREVALSFQALLESPLRMVLWQTLFLAAAVGVVAAGVRRGLGLFVWVAVPGLMALLWLLLDFAFSHGDLAAARRFLFGVQPLDFGTEALLVAMGQAFFTLTVGAAVGISYGSYSPERLPIGRSVIAVAIFDTAIALAAGVAIFPVVLATNIEPAMGPGLLFVSVPYAFGNLPEGDVYGTLFFVLAGLAALGSAVALVEPSVSVLSQQLRWRRWQAALAVGALIWALSLAVALSLAPGSSLSGLLPLLDGLTVNVLLPLGALAVAIFVGWRMDKQSLREELYREGDLFFKGWLFLLRFVAPLAILIVWCREILLAD